MMNSEMLESIETLASCECECYRDGICTETGRECHIVNHESSTLDEDAIDCDYFLDYVLPADWTVDDLIAYAMWYSSDGKD